MVGGGPPFAIPSRIAVNGPFPGATSPIIDYVRQNSGWTVARPLPNALPAIENGQDNSGVFPQFRSDNDGPPGTLMQGNGTSTLNGLPASNGDFGINSVTHLFQGAPLDVSNIEVFYQAGATTHAAGGPVKGFTHPDVGGTHSASDEIDTANFIYYYNQAYTSPVTIEYYVDPANTSTQAYYFPGDDHIHIAHRGHGTRLTARFQNATAGNSASALSFVGWEETYGIDSFVRLIAHENKHKWIYENFHQSIVDAGADSIPDTYIDANGVEQAGDPDADPDGDGLPTHFERANGLDPMNALSTTLDTAFGSLGYGDDQEVIVRLAESGNFGVRETDWAHDGLNHGTVPNQSLGQRTRILNVNQGFLHWTYGGP